MVDQKASNMVDQKASNMVDQKAVKDTKLLQIKKRNLKHVIQCYNIVHRRFGTTPQRMSEMGKQHTNREHWGKQSNHS